MNVSLERIKTIIKAYPEELKTRAKAYLEKITTRLRTLLSKTVSPKIVFILPIIELLGVIVTQDKIYLLLLYLQVQLMAVCWCAYIGIKKDLQLFLFIYFSWVCATDFLFSSFDISIPVTASLLETGIFTAIVFWIYNRPERIPSDPPSETVQIAFYYGDKSPLIARIASFLGLPVTGIGLIIGAHAMMVRGKTEKMIRLDRIELRKWIKLDTHVTASDEICEAFNAYEKQHVTYAGCLSALAPFLSMLGKKYKPSLAQSPSSYMSQVLGLR